MKRTMIALKLWFAGMLILPAMGVRAEEAIPFPERVPPVMATATVGGPGKIGTLAVDWRINLTIPKITWEVIDNRVLLTEIKARVKPLKTSLRMGGPSPLSPSRVVDRKGGELTRDQVVKRLKNETPVLLSITGGMPDAYYLQLISDDALIILYGARDHHHDMLGSGGTKIVSPADYLPQEFTPHSGAAKEAGK